MLHALCCTAARCTGPFFRHRLLPLLILGALLLPSPVSAEDGLRCIGPDPKQAASQAVVVDSLPLAHTTQLLPVNAHGKIVGRGAPAKQAAHVLKSARTALAAAGASLQQAVKVNAYCVDQAAVDALRQALRQEFAGEHQPAFSVVITRLPHPDAVLALDVVAVAKKDAAKADASAPRQIHCPELGDDKMFAQVAVLPAASRVYISGQAEQGDLATATRKTLESLRASLKWMDLNDTHIVQFKAFLQPIADVGIVRQEFVKFFAGQPVPPVVFVEWKSGPRVPIEIELIAAAPKTEGSAVEYLTPPGMKASPVYCRVARVAPGKTIYISGLHAATPGNGKEQVTDLFSTLQRILEQSGSDLRHLVKATYYVSEDTASTALNELRPSYYDPKRPPAASKAIVTGVGQPGRTITIDMIAVPKD